MFDPLDWYRLAHRLAEADDEASIRTAIGRSYYGVFLKSRDTLRGGGLIDVRYDDGDHRLVTDALRASRRGNASDALRQLRIMRNEADYDTSIAIDGRDWSDAERLADEVIRLCSPDWEA